MSAKAKKRKRCVCGHKRHIKGASLAAKKSGGFMTLSPSERDLIEELGQVLLLATERTEEKKPMEQFHFHQMGNDKHLSRICRACLVLKRWEEWRKTQC